MFVCSSSSGRTRTQNTDNITKEVDLRHCFHAGQVVDLLMREKFTVLPQRADDSAPAGECALHWAVSAGDCHP